MQTCDKLLHKKPKRSFVEAWLNDKRYKDWIQKVSSDKTLYYCIVCKKNFSCDSHVSRHANSPCHKKNLKKNIPNNDDITVQNKTQFKLVFRQEWLDVDNFKLWLRENPSDESICFCAICGKFLIAHLSNVRRHAESTNHLNLCKEKGIRTSESNDDFKESLLSFDERKKSAEIQYAALVAEKNIPHQAAKEILSFFQSIGQEPDILKSMSMS